MKMKEGQRKGENLVLVGLDSFSLKSETCLGPFWLNLHQQGPWHSSFHPKKTGKARLPQKPKFVFSCQNTWSGKRETFVFCNDSFHQMGKIFQTGIKNVVDL